MPPESKKRSASSHGTTGSEDPRTRKKGKLERGIPNVSWDNRFGALDKSSLDNATRRLLEGCTETTVPPVVSLTTIVQNSSDFPLEFPIDTVQISEFQKRRPNNSLQLNINSTYPLIHEDTLPLIANWLKHKKEHGSAVEKTLYEEMGLIEFIQRLLECRAFSFYGRKDNYKILEVEQGFGGWEQIGTGGEKPPLVLQNYLSYDEIKLSALLAISSNTEVINEGSRKNKGIVTTNIDDVVPECTIVGVAGARLQKPGFMEYQDIAVSEDQNTVENGYGPTSAAPSNARIAAFRDLRRVWARFYGQSHLPLYEEISEHLRRTPDHPKYLPVRRKHILDVENYIKRTQLTAEMILIDANSRGRNLNNNQTFIHIAAAFGLEVSKALPEQERYFLKAFEIAMKNMMEELHFVSDVAFCHFKSETSCGGVTDGGQIGHVNIYFENREPYAVHDDDYPLYVTYPLDGNAYPGNEFWMGKLTKTGASAAACSTQIAELHNVRINPRASATNLRIASPKLGILHIADYAKRKL